MDYKQKYTEALERARDYHSKDYMLINNAIENIFPELKDDKDGWIKDDIKDVIQAAIIPKESKREMIAWLEKQGEKKSADEVLKIRQELYQSGYNDGYKHRQEDITKSLSMAKNINNAVIKEKAHQIAWETSKDYDPSLSKEAWCEMAALDMASWLKREVDAAYLQGICDAKNEIERQGKQKQTWEPNAAQLIVIKDLIEDKSTSKVNKIILRGMLDEFKQFTDTRKMEIEKHGENKQEPVQKPFDYEHATIHQKDFAPKDEPNFNIEIPFGAIDSELQEVSYDIPEGFNAEIKDDMVVIKKVEPKFHPGDWIVDDETPNDVFCVIEVLGEIYKVIDIDGDDYHIPHCKADKQFHLWSISDAEDGDVLYSPWCKLLWIYKDEKTCHVGSNLNYNSDSIVINKPVCIPTDVQPATKEQRDLFFCKMHDAGYEWDADKKELKRMEATSKEIEDEQIKEEIIRILKGETRYTSKEDADKYITWFEKKGKQIDPDKVIEWLEINASMFWDSPCNPSRIVELFKKDFQL